MKGRRLSLLAIATVLTVAGSASGSGAADPYPFDGTWSGTYSGTQSVFGRTAPFSADITFSVRNGAISGNFTGSVAPSGSGSVSAGTYRGVNGSCTGSLSFTGGSMRSTGTVECRYGSDVTASGRVTADRQGGAKPQPDPGTKPTKPTSGKPTTTTGGTATVTVAGSGKAVIQRAAGGRVELDGTFTLAPGDKILTSGSPAMVTLPNGFELSLDKNGSFTFCGDSGPNFKSASWRCSPHLKDVLPQLGLGWSIERNASPIYEQLKGFAHYLFKKPTKTLVTTGNVVIAVRGTEFTVQRTPAGDVVRVYHGTVKAFTTFRGKSCQVATVAKGRETVVAPRSCPLAARSFKPPAKPFWTSIPLGRLQRVILSDGDTVVTGAGTIKRADIPSKLFPASKSVLVVGEQSRVQVTILGEYKISGAVREFMLTRGAVWYTTFQTTSTVKTPYAEISVGDTWCEGQQVTWSVELLRDGSGSYTRVRNYTACEISAGPSVAICDPTDTRCARMPKGTETIIRPGQAATTPQPFTPPAKPFWLP